MRAIHMHRLQAQRAQAGQAQAGVCALALHPQPAAHLQRPHRRPDELPRVHMHHGPILQRRVHGDCYGQVRVIAFPFRLSSLANQQSHRDQVIALHGHGLRFGPDDAGVHCRRHARRTHGHGGRRRGTRRDLHWRQRRRQRWRRWREPYPSGGRVGADPLASGRRVHVARVLLAHARARALPSAESHSAPLGPKKRRRASPRTPAARCEGRAPRGGRALLLRPREGGDAVVAPAQKV